MTKHIWVKDVDKEISQAVIRQMTRKLSRDGHSKGSRYITGFRREGRCGQVGIYLEVPVQRKIKRE